MESLDLQRSDAHWDHELSGRSAELRFGAFQESRPQRADSEIGARVPGRSLVYRDERFPTGVVTPTVAEPPGRLRKEPA